MELGVLDVGQIGHQSPPGLKLFEAQAGTAAEYDKAAAEKYKAEIDTRMKTLEDEAWMECGLELVGGLEHVVFIFHFIYGRIIPTQTN